MLHESSDSRDSGGAAASDQAQALIRDQFEPKFFGPVNIIKAALPYMRGQRIGHMIVLRGITGHLGMPGLGIYCAATWALEGFCDSITYEIAPFNIKMTIVQASIEIGILLNRITSASAHHAYSRNVKSAPLFRRILDRLLTLSGAYSPVSEVGPLSGSGLLNRTEVVTLHSPLSRAHTEKLLAETVHAITAIGGHENPPARHIVADIVAVEGVASVKEKLKTVSEELEGFVEASKAVDVPTASYYPAKTDITGGEEDGPVDFGGHNAVERHIHG